MFVTPATFVDFAAAGFVSGRAECDLEQHALLRNPSHVDA